MRPGNEAHPYVYLATDGKLWKIGMSNCPIARMDEVYSPLSTQKRRVRTYLVAAWYWPSCARLREGLVKDRLSDKRYKPHMSEWFAVTGVEIAEAIRSSFGRHNPYPIPLDFSATEKA